MGHVSEINGWDNIEVLHWLTKYNGIIDMESVQGFKLY